MEKTETWKVLVTAHRQDETEIFEKVNKRFGFSLSYQMEQLTLENVNALEGYDAVAINAGCEVDPEMAKAMHEAGIRYIATRTAGKDHIDKTEIEKYGIKAANVPGYSPNAISPILASVMIGTSLPSSMILAVSYALDNGLEIHRSNGISCNPSAVSSARCLPN